MSTLTDMPNTDLHSTADGQVDAVTRTVSTTDNGNTFTTGAGLRQRFDVTVDELWAALTSADRLSLWFAPVSGDLQVGGRYQIEGNAGGVIETCDSRDGFTITWEFGEDISHLAVSLDVEDDGLACLTVEHRAEVAAERWIDYGPGAVGVGWDLALLGLAHHLATGASPAAESAAWSETDQAQRFMSDSSRRWADASVSAGTPEVAAQASEMRTTAFYLGTGVPDAP